MHVIAVPEDNDVGCQKHVITNPGTDTRQFCDKPSCLRMVTCFSRVEYLCREHAFECVAELLRVLSFPGTKEEAKAEHDLLNPERLDLIERRFDGTGLSDAETDRFKWLQNRCRMLVDILVPFDYSYSEHIATILERHGYYERDLSKERLGLSGMAE